VDRPTGVPGVLKRLPPEWFVLHERVAEMRFDTLGDDYLTPVDRFFVRNQGSTAVIEPAGWRLRIDGPGVRRRIEFTYDQLLAMASTRVVCGLECAGNGRAFFAGEDREPPEGTRWRLGGVGVAEWTGVSLGELLDRAAVARSAVDVMPIGLDELRVRRPLPLAKATEDGTLVAVAMNGEPLRADHGFPARVIVPGWAGIASIKWVGRIHVATEALRSRWNTETYVLRDGEPGAGDRGGTPITEMGVKSAVQLPWPATLPAGRLVIRGRSWSGCGRIVRVDVSVDGGRTWQEAVGLEPNHPRAWVRWRFEWDARPGERGIRVRATDHLGNTQPDRVPWNTLGYLYDGVVEHPVRVTR
jgi:DMSO/TMAO reductase YedYZ molybdopterin-dependent catalytic subunit